MNSRQEQKAHRHPDDRQNPPVREQVYLRGELLLSRNIKSIYYSHIKKLIRTNIWINLSSSYPPTFSLNTSPPEYINFLTSHISILSLSHKRQGSEESVLPSPFRFQLYLIKTTCRPVKRYLGAGIFKNCKFLEVGLGGRRFVCVWVCVWVKAFARICMYVCMYMYWWGDGFLRGILH